MAAAAVAQSAGAVAGKLFRSKWFWYTVIVLIALFILWKFWKAISTFVHDLFTRDITDYSNEPELTEEDKAALDQLAADLFAEFDGPTLSTRVFDRVKVLRNRALKYLAQQYPNYSDGESLKEAIADELIGGDDDAKLIARLNAMNL